VEYGFGDPLDWEFDLANNALDLNIDSLSLGLGSPDPASNFMDVSYDASEFAAHRMSIPLVDATGELLLMYDFCLGGMKHPRIGHVGELAEFVDGIADRIKEDLVVSADREGTGTRVFLVVCVLVKSLDRFVQALLSSIDRRDVRDFPCLTDDLDVAVDDVKTKLNRMRKSIPEHLRSWFGNHASDGLAFPDAPMSELSIDSLPELKLKLEEAQQAVRNSLRLN
jgi:hypothetical protein